MRTPDCFYVDNPLYGKDGAYGTFCEEQVQMLNRVKPVRLGTAIELLTTEIDRYYKAQHKVFGSYRQLDTEEHGRTSDQHQHDVIKLTLTRIFGSEEKITPYTIDCVLPSEEDSSIPRRRVPLTSIVAEDDGRYGLRHFFSHDETSSYNAELLWSECSKSFHRALTPSRLAHADPTREFGERKAAAIECYWNLSHYMPYKRGSATAARIVLEHLADQIGFSIGKPKKDVDINIDALLRDKASFVKEFDHCFEQTHAQGNTHGTPAGSSQQR